MPEVDERYTDFDGNPLSDADVAALKALESRALAEDAEGWRPDPGDTITGIVTDIDEGSSEYGEYPLLTIRNADGETAVHCFHTILQNRVERLIAKGKLVEGSLISIHYAGQTGEAKNGHSAPHTYKVAVQARTTA